MYLHITSNKFIVNVKLLLRNHSVCKLYITNKKVGNVLRQHLLGPSICLLFHFLACYFISQHTCMCSKLPLKVDICKYRYMLYAGFMLLFYTCRQCCSVLYITIKSCVSVLKIKKKMKNPPTLIFALRQWGDGGENKTRTNIISLYFPVYSLQIYRKKTNILRQLGGGDFVQK